MNMDECLLQAPSDLMLTIGKCRQSSAKVLVFMSRGGLSNWSVLLMKYSVVLQLPSPK